MAVVVEPVAEVAGRKAVADEGEDHPPSFHAKRAVWKALRRPPLHKRAAEVLAWGCRSLQSAIRKGKDARRPTRRRDHPSAEQPGLRLLQAALRPARGVIGHHPARSR